MRDKDYSRWSDTCIQHAKAASWRAAPSEPPLTRQHQEETADADRLPLVTYCSATERGRGCTTYTHVTHVTEGLLTAWNDQRGETTTGRSVWAIPQREFTDVVTATKHFFSFAKKNIEADFNSDVMETISLQNFRGVGRILVEFMSSVKGQLKK